MKVAIVRQIDSLVFVESDKDVAANEVSSDETEFNSNIQCSHCLDMFPPEQIELGDDGTMFCRVCIEDMKYDFYYND